MRQWFETLRYGIKLCTLLLGKRLRISASRAIAPSPGLWYQFSLRPYRSWINVSELSQFTSMTRLKIKKATRDRHVFMDPQISFLKIKNPCPITFRGELPFLRPGVSCKKDTGLMKYWEGATLLLLKKWRIWKISSMENALEKNFPFLMGHRISSA